jgi:hypothetical protein
MGISISKPRILICEGAADKAFFEHLLSQRNLPQFDVFHPFELDGVASGNTGFRDFLRGLSLLLPSANASGILLVSDNDLDPDGSFQKVRTQIQEADGFGVPATPLEVARSANYPPVVVMMLPRAGVPGALETLCLDAIYAARPELKDCVDEYCDCTGTSGWNQIKQSKMRLESLMAAICQSRPATALKLAWSQKETIIPLDRDVFDPIAEFLREFDTYVAP